MIIKPSKNTLRTKRQIITTERSWRLLQLISATGHLSRIVGDIVSEGGKMKHNPNIPFVKQVIFTAIENLYQEQCKKYPTKKELKRNPDAAITTIQG